MIHGIINIYKEKGFTSHDVVAKARGILRQKKIGHTGTLDPDAVGVLPLCLGMGTKLVPYLTDADKCYEAEVILGAYTTTEDASGEILDTFDVNASQTEILEIIQSFVGDYTQIPPMYSAIKVNGVKLYELARQGIVIDRPERHVIIYSCELLEFLDERRFRIRVNCSKGTYIRTLCTDIGRKLGCGAHMGELVRTRVGGYTIEESITLAQLEEMRDTIEDKVSPIEGFFENYPIGRIKEAYQKAIDNGNPLPFEAVECDVTGLEKLRIYDTTDTFVGVYFVDELKQRLSVDKMFVER